MTKKRVYEIAKDLDWDNKKVIEALHRIGVGVKNHMSVVEEADEAVARLRAAEKEASPPAPGKGAPPPPSLGAATRPAVRPSAELKPATRPAAPPASRLFNKEDLRRQERIQRLVAERPPREEEAPDAPAVVIGGMGRPGDRGVRRAKPAEARRPRSEASERRRERHPATRAETPGDVEAKPSAPPVEPAEQEAPAATGAALREEGQVVIESASEAPAAAAPAPAPETASAPAAPAVTPPVSETAPDSATEPQSAAEDPAPVGRAAATAPPVRSPKPPLGPREAGRLGMPMPRRSDGRPPARTGEGRSFGPPARPGMAGRPDGPRPGGMPRPGMPRVDRGARPGGGPRPGGGLRVPAPPATTAQPAGGKPVTGKQQRRQRDRWSSLERRAQEQRVSRPGAMQRKSASAPPKNVKPVVLEGPLTVRELGIKIAVSAPEIIKTLLGLGVRATINQEIDVETGQIVLQEMGIPVEVRVEPTEEELEAAEAQDDLAELAPRAPVVTIMGHVDHGKTTLLDAIRETRVAAGEAGGITQHIGAYTIELKGRKITFLDTPGHEAFTAMRARGAQVTDVAVLVVAADDGVMPQTIEAINHVKAAKVPIVVAINKIDKKDANPDRVKQELTEHGLVAEEWGGDAIMAPVSAKEKFGLDHLLEMLLLVADVRELKANPNRPARGTVIEAQLDKGRGPVATVLVQSGTLKLGDAVVAGGAYGKVRAMIDDKGKRVKKAGPSTPVEVLGFAEVPQAGDIFRVADDERAAREAAHKRANLRRQTELTATSRMSLEDLQRKIQEGELRDLNIVLKADVQGSVEALKTSLEKLRNEEVRVSVIHGGVGAITESDIMLATASGAIIIGFNVRPDPNARLVGEREKVDIRLYRVIYDAIDDVKAAIEGMLKPKLHEVVLGRAEVRALFKVPKVGTVAGCYVTEGKINKSASARILRDNVVAFEGKIASLRRFKEDTREVAAGFECGIGIENFNDLKEGDQIEVFSIEEVKPA